MPRRRAAGATVHIVHSARSALQLARDHPQRSVVFLAVGFETTAPAHAMAVLQASRAGLRNFSLLVSHACVPPAIEAILCDGMVEVTARTGDGTPLAVGRRSRVIPPQLRRSIMDRDGAACTIAGCTSRYRLQVHHIVRWIDGGKTDPENLTTVCWFHHQVVIHGRGFSIDPESPPQRRRLLHPPIHGPPWLEHARTRGMIITEKPRYRVTG